MEDKICPMKIEITNDAYWCLGKRCAWWIEVYESESLSVPKKVGRCAITQLAIEINCNVKGGR